MSVSLDLSDGLNIWERAFKEGWMFYQIDSFNLILN